MMPIRSYPKVYNLGHAAIADLLLDDVVVEEKFDGSQWSWCVDDDGLHCRSKGKQMDPGQQDKMFDKAVESVQSRVDGLVKNWTYRGEFLSKPKHNTLCYDHVPTGNIVLFDIDRGDQDYLSWEEKHDEANRLGFACPPLLLSGKLESFERFSELLETVSLLGGQTVEGLVIKNYHQFGRDGKCLMGKFVSEKFKEFHAKDWKGRHPAGKEIRQSIGQSLRTEARWHKALQHLREDGRLTDSVRDIGPLIKEIQLDTMEECEEKIKDVLFNWAKRDINRIIIRGFPDWYKELLARRQFNGEIVDS